MTESEWLACTNPRKMIASLRRVSDRKFYLLAAASSRRVWDLFPHRALQQVVVVLEQFADGLVEWEDVLAARESVYTAAKEQRRQARQDEARQWQTSGLKTYHATLALVKGTARDSTRTAMGELAIAAYFAAMEVKSDQEVSNSERWKRGENATKRERASQCDLLRDIFPPPPRKERLIPAWLTPTVQSVAQAAYDERNLPRGELDTQRFSILADSLEDAGCTNADILNHCRQSAVHVRGCWVIDLLLGKE